VSVPELPEVEALADFLRTRAVGLVITRIDVGAVNVLKTFDPRPTGLHGMTIAAVSRRGKFLDLDVDGLHLVTHLARAGWLRWYVAVRVHLLEPASGATPGLDLTEAGTRKRLAVYVVRSTSEIPAIASLGPDPLAADFDRQTLSGILSGSRQQVKGLLRDQSVLAGVGNAYSDEVLHAARLSPFAIAGRLDDVEVTRLYDALRGVLRTAVEGARGKPATGLKDAKRAGMRVHGRTGQPCPVCGDVVREVSFADSALQYCATCQTGGKVLADRRMSRLLK
jgi:formamidopyrimidine-DNA glycosylase